MPKLSQAQKKQFIVHFMLHCLLAVAVKRSHQQIGNIWWQCPSPLLQTAGTWDWIVHHTKECTARKQPCFTPFDNGKAWDSIIQYFHHYVIVELPDNGNEFAGTAKFFHHLLQAIFDCIEALGQADKGHARVAVLLLAFSLQLSNVSLRVPHSVWRPHWLSGIRPCLRCWRRGWAKHEPRSCHLWTSSCHKTLDWNYSRRCGQCSHLSTVVGTFPSFDMNCKS